MDTREFEAQLAKDYKYKKIPVDYAKECRKFFKENIPDFLHMEGSSNQCLYTKNGSLLSIGYKRIVIGDYGAFIEIDPNQASVSTFEVKNGQEYRINDPKYCYNVKYHWYTIDDDSDIKIYYQIKGVSYADYVPGLFYVSVHEVAIQN